MTGDLYVQSVIEHVPHGSPLREQIAMELRSNIAERTAQGQALGDVLAQLGDPLTLAESYLASVPLTAASASRRLMAKLVDVVLVVLVAVGIAAVLWSVLPPPLVHFVPVICVFGGLCGFIAYTVATEYRTGRTLGKRILGILVVRESGARISLGQSLLRQLPFLGQFFFIDALFVLFTDKKQRAFEMLSKTRAVASLLAVAAAMPSGLLQ
jgi:uncharacterized RDD family membrane protein YckC